MIEVKGKYTIAKIMIDDVEPECMAQIHHFINHPAFTNSIAIMPDAHTGSGSCIGFTMPLTEKLVPNVIGVDIGCGVDSVNIGNNLPLSLEDLDMKIRAKIPFGQNVHEDAIINMKDNFPWKKVNSLAEKFRASYQEKFKGAFSPPRYDVDWFLQKCKDIGGNVRYFINSVGSLGGGNHFIEIGLSSNNDYWITVHSGSRNLGKKICEYWQGRAVKFWRKDRREELAKEIEHIKAEEKDGKVIFDKIKAIKKEMKLDTGIDMKKCEWLESDLSRGYLIDMIFAQTYAKVNREYIINLILKFLNIEAQDKISCTHNFIDFRDFIVRKGAIRSYEKERILIPFNMRDGILICNGKSNPEWNFSAPHGAGRVLSRSGAKKKLNVEEFKKQMEGVYSTSVGFSTLDEAPEAYKDSKIIEEAIGPTAKIIDRIKPILNMKDAGGSPPWKKK